MSLSDWHRKQHKKQLHKNKASRIAQRDAAAIETKTAGGIQNEIRELLRRQPKSAVDDESLLPHAIKGKLDRLRKELRLVQQEDEKRKAGGGVASGGVGAADFENYPAFMRYALRGSLEARYGVGSLGFRGVRATGEGGR